MRAGRRDRRVRIERKTLTKDTVGADVEAWVKVADVWAEYLPTTGKEFVAAQQILGESVVQLSILYRRDLTRLDRIVYNGEKYDIKNIDEIGRRRGQKLTCQIIDGN